MNENYIKASRIMEHYGAQHQLTKLCEECGELIQQACKCVDSGQPYSEEFVEELADVRVLTMQFETVMSQPDRDLIDKIITEKLERQLDRIEEEST